MAKLLGLDEYEVHGAVTARELEASKIEGRTYISTEAVQDYVARLRGK